MGIKEQQALFRHISNNEYRWYPAHYATHPVIGSDLVYITDGSASAFGTVIATNIVANPSFETASAAVEVRRNLHSRSTATGSWNYWPGNGAAAATQAYLTGSGHPLSDTFTRVTITVSGTSASDVGPYTAAAVTPGIVGGGTYSVRVSGRTSRSANVTSYRPQLRWYDAGNAQVGASIMLTVPFEGAGIWHEGVLENLVAPATATGLFVASWFLTSTGSVAGETYDATMASVVAEASAGPAIHGAMPPIGDYTYSWVGTANASASIQTAPGVSNASFGSNRKAIQSSTWATDGGKSVKIYSDNLSGIAGGGLVSMTLPPGFYTAVATLKIDAPGDGSSSSRRLLYNGVLVASGGTGPQYGDQAPNVPGEYTLRMHFERNATDTEQSVRLLGNGVGEEQSAWWDNLTVVSIPSLSEPYLGPAFNGSTDIPGPEGTRWTGTPHASTSQLGTEVNTTAYPDIPRWPS